MMTRRDFALSCTAAIAAGTSGSLSAADIPEQFDTVFPKGPVNPYGKFFTGTSYLTMLSNADNVFNCPIGNVTFEAGCRTFWHRHSGGQILLVLAGVGLYQEKGRPARRIRKGDVVRIAPDVEHWHGACSTEPMTHVSIETNVPSNKTTWLSAVSEAEYAQADKA